MKWLMLLIGLLLFSSLVMAAEPTQQSNKIFLNPFYRASMTNNANNSFNISINPPDGFSKVVSAIVSFDIYITPTVTFNLWVNNKTCNNPNFTISTTFASSGQSRITFDCSNLINQSGNYNLTLRPSGANTGATSGWLDLTYMNNPKASLDVHGTEYRPEEPAKVWLQLLNSSNQDINTAICKVDIYNPDGTEYIERAVMTNQQQDAIYYYNIDAPTTQGVYPAIAKCIYSSTTNPNNASGSTLLNGTSTGGTTYTNTYLDDNVYHTVNENAGITPRRLDIIYNFTNVTQPALNVSLGWQIYWAGKWETTPSGDNLNISIMNQTSGQWIILPNHISAISGDQFVSNSETLPQVNLTLQGYISSAKHVDIRITDMNISDGTTSTLQTDQIYFSIDSAIDSSGVWTEVRGASELHVNDWFDYYRESYSNSSWNFENRTLTNFSNFDVNETSIANAVWNYSGTVSSNILTQFATAIWTAATRTLTAFGFFDYSTAALYNWNSTNRTLSSFNFSVNATATVNETSIANATWEFPYRYTHGVVLS